MIYAINMVLDTEAHSERIRLKLAERANFSIPLAFQTLIFQSIYDERDR